MAFIDPRGKLSPEDYLYLYWYEKITNNINIDYADFQPTESMINNYNAYIKQWVSNFYKDRVHCEKPVDWDVSRKKTSYFKEKLQAGHEFEIWVEQEFQKRGIELGHFLDEKGQFSGENKFGLEIKHDMRLAETGNIYLEYQERLRNTNSWVNSGILKKDNSIYWIIGSPIEYYFFRKSDLVSLYNALRSSPAAVSGCRFVAEKANGTSKGFIMNRTVAKKIALSNSIDGFAKIIKK